MSYFRYFKVSLYFARDISRAPNFLNLWEYENYEISLKKNDMTKQTAPWMHLHPVYLVHSRDWVSNEVQVVQFVLSTPFRMYCPISMAT